MDYLTVANQLIPGYDCLSAEQQQAFSQTRAGNKIAQIVKSLQPHWFNFDHPSEQMSKAMQNLSQQKDTLLANLQQLDGFYRAKVEIICTQSLKRYPHLKGVIDDPEQMTTILDGHFEPEEINRRLIIWHNKLFDNVIYRDIYIKERVAAWENFFPLLQSKSQSSPGRLIDDWIYDNYILENGSFNPEIRDKEHQQLTQAIYLVIQEETSAYFGIFGQEAVSLMQELNWQEAQQIASDVQMAFNNGTSLSLDRQLTSYQKKLMVKIEEFIFHINQRQWRMQDAPFQGAAYSAISALIDKMADRLALMADGHAIIQATGFATQNENSHLAFLDFINYWRYARKLSEVKTITSGLLQPLLPLYLEYRSIGLNENYMLAKPFRTIIPAIIIAATVVAVFGLLSTFGALPELAALVVLLPTIYLGGLLATLYIEAKNAIYNGLYMMYYGGVYKTPNYQINARMVESFGSLARAQMVRDYYVKELQACELFESHMQAKDIHGVLTTLEINARKDNIIRKNKLTMEWVDVHSNKAFGVDKVPLLVDNRLHQDGDCVFTHLTKAWHEHDRMQLTNNMNETTERIKARFENRNVAPTSFQFFKPSCLTHKQQLERIDEQRNALLA